MPIQVLMPPLSPTMTSGRLTRWLVVPGAHVEPGDVIAEIETDTATMEVEAVDAGRIERLLVAAGTRDVRAGTPIATLIGDDDGLIATPPRRPSRTALAAQADAQETVSPRTSAPVHRIVASPLARRLAREAGLDLAAITGSGPGGRIVERDVAGFTGDAAPVGRLTAEPSRALLETGVTYLRPSPEPGDRGLTDADIRSLYEPGSYDLVPHEQMRSIIAARLSLSKRTVPHFYLRVDVRMDEVQRARQRMNGGPVARSGAPLALTINDFIVKALALALQQVPSANVTWSDAAMLRHRFADVGVAVAVDGGLMTPVIRQAETKSLSEISEEVRTLADRARRRRLAPHEYQGGATSISNLGMHGVREFDAVINPPQSTILAVGAAEARPVVIDGRLEVATMMSCSLACDHRAVDGAVGAELLAVFKSLLEDPLRMIV